MALQLTERGKFSKEALQWKSTTHPPYSPALFELKGLCLHLLALEREQTPAFRALT